MTTTKKLKEGQLIEILCHNSKTNTDQWLPGTFTGYVTALDRDFRVNCTLTDTGAELTECAPECVRSANINDWSRWNEQSLTHGQKIEISEDIYEQLMGCVPPINCNGSYFEVGEADHHTNAGRAVYRACWKEEGKYYTGYPRIKKEWAASTK